MFTITQSKPIFIGGIYKPFPVMDGLWHCFTHIIPLIFPIPIPLL